MLRGTENSEDPDQTASGAVWSGFALFAYGFLSETLVFEILGHLPYIKYLQYNYFRTYQNPRVFSLRNA